MVSNITAKHLTILGSLGWMVRKAILLDIWKRGLFFGWSAGCILSLFSYCGQITVFRHRGNSPIRNYRAALTIYTFDSFSRSRVGAGYSSFVFIVFELCLCHYCHYYDSLKEVLTFLRTLSHKTACSFP